MEEEDWECYHPSERSFLYSTGSHFDMFPVDSRRKEHLPAESVCYFNYTVWKGYLSIYVFFSGIDYKLISYSIHGADFGMIHRQIEVSEKNIKGYLRYALTHYGKIPSEEEIDLLRKKFVNSMAKIVNERYPTYMCNGIYLSLPYPESIGIPEEESFIISVKTMIDKKLEDFENEISDMKKTMETSGEEMKKALNENRDMIQTMYEFLFAKKEFESLSISEKTS